MVKLLPLRIGRKKTGNVSIKDGEFKMVVKERARLIGILSTSFGVVIGFCMFVAPYIVIFIGFIWLISTTLLAGLLDAIVWGGDKIINGVKWTGKWCIKQPVEDFRYGRRKRKDYESTRTYGSNINR